MNSIRSRRLSFALAALFSISLMACGPENTSQSCDGEPCLDSSSDRPGAVESPAMCGEQSNCDEGPEDPGGGEPVPAPIPTNAVFFNDSGATRLFKIYASTGDTVLPLTELRMQQTVNAPAWSYRAGTSPTLTAEVWTNYGPMLGSTTITLSATAASVNCTFRYVEWIPGSGGQVAIYPTCT